MPDQQSASTYTGVSSGRFGKFRKAAKDAERQARDDLANRGQWPPREPITFKADFYVKVGNPIHQYIVELRQQP